MKKVLLATTALVATAGFAMADISLSGSAEMGIAVGPDKSAEVDYEGGVIAKADADAADLAADADDKADAAFTAFDPQFGAEDGNTPAADVIDAAKAVIDDEGAADARVILAKAVIDTDAAAVLAAEAVAAAAAGANSIDADNDGEMHVYSGVTLVVTFSGTTDNGLEFGASMNAETSSSDYDPGDFEFDQEEAALGFGSVWISGGGLTLTVDDDGIDDLENGDNTHDVQIDYATGPISFSATWDVDSDSGDDSTFSYSFGYDQDGISASLTGDDNSDCTALAAGYAAGAFSVGLKADQGCGTSVNTLSASFSADAFTLSVEGADDDSWSVAASYSQDGLSVSASTDSGSYSEVTGSMDLGGGASIVAGFNSDEAYYLGAALSF